MPGGRDLYVYERKKKRAAKGSQKQRAVVECRFVSREHTSTTDGGGILNVVAMRMR